MGMMQHHARVWGRHPNDVAFQDRLLQATVELVPLCDDKVSHA